MNEASCRTIAATLVAYSDGELPEAERRQFEAHLAACPGCRVELRLLDHSLSLAKEIWRESADEAAVVSCGTGLPTRPGRLARAVPRLAAAALLAACAAGLVLVLHARWFSSGDRGRQVARPEAGQAPVHAAKQTADSAPAKPSLDDRDIQTYIDRQARAARLAAAIELLATQPSLKQYKDEAERYLARAYPDADLGKNSLRPASGTGAAASSKEPKS